MVPAASIVLIITDILLGVLVPVLLLIYFRKKYNASLKSFFIGCAVMLVFALILESIVHNLVLGSNSGQAILNSTWLYALYGSFMAALFEESGRYLAMRYVLKKEHADRHNSLMYGAGHGGFEMFFLMSIGMINQLIYSLALNSGGAEALLSSLDGTSREALQAAFDTLISTPSWQFLISPLERLAAVTAQISLSVIVWHAAVGRKGLLFFTAFLMHMLLDAVAVITAGLGVPLLAVEGIVWIIAVCFVFIAVAVWKNNAPEQPVKEADNEELSAV